MPRIRPARPDELTLLPDLEAAADTMFEPLGIGPLPAPGTVEEFAAALIVLVAGDPPVGTAAQSLTTVSYGAGAAVNAAAIAKYFGPDITVTASSSLTAGQVVVTLGVATLALPAPLVGPASKPTSATSPSAGSGSVSSTSGAADALTPQEKQWAEEANAKYGIPCVY